MEGLIYYLTIGVITCVNIFMFSRIWDGKSFEYVRFTKIVRWFAGASFTLYLTNEPLLIFLSAFSPMSAVDKVIAVISVIIAVLLLAEIGERRKAQYKKVFCLVLFWLGIGNRGVARR
jgi:peptidoglycan/LPS O-acetylase OafA/YrhL